MAGTTRYLLKRDGRYFARLVVPEALRPFLDGRREMRTALGGDRRVALRELPAAVAQLQNIIRDAELKSSVFETGKPRTPRFLLSVEQIALHSYQQRLSMDEDARNSNPAYALVGIDDHFVNELRAGVAGRLSDDRLSDLVGHRISHYVKMGSSDVEKGSEGWRNLARALCASELEALERVSERDEGDFSGALKNPILVKAASSKPQLAPVSLAGLFSSYIASRKLLGTGAGAETRWRPVFAGLRKYLGHDDANRLSKKDLMAFRDQLLQTKAPKTVSGVWLSAIRTVLAWAVREDRLANNVAQDVRQDVPRHVLSREKG